MDTKKTVKKLYVGSEMIKAGVWGQTLAKDDLDEIYCTLAAEEGGCMWDFRIVLRRLHNDHAAMLLNMFSDSWKALGEAPEIFKVLERFASKSQKDDREAWPKFIQALEDVGWKREKPEPREKPKPTVCYACGRP